MSRYCGAGGRVTGQPLRPCHGASTHSTLAGRPLMAWRQLTFIHSGIRTAALLLGAADLLPLPVAASLPSRGNRPAPLGASRQQWKHLSGQLPPLSGWADPLPPTLSSLLPWWTDLHPAVLTTAPAAAPGRIPPLPGWADLHSRWRHPSCPGGWTDLHPSVGPDNGSSGSGGCMCSSKDTRVHTPHTCSLCSLRQSRWTGTSAPYRLTN